MNNFSHLQIGKFGEDYCAKYLKRIKKLKILARNVTIGKLEMDIIAYDDKYLVFVEVKTRSADKNNYFRPSAAVNHEKRTNLITFAYAYCRSLPVKLKDKIPRIDVCEILVTADKKLKVCEVNYIENAVSRR